MHQLSVTIAEWTVNGYSYHFTVEVLSETAYGKLPVNIRERRGCNPTQKNVLIRITLRHRERSLTNQEVNQIYSDTYGTGGYL